MKTCSAGQLCKSLCFGVKNSTSKVKPVWKCENKTYTYIFAVLRLGEVDEVIIVHVLSVEQVTVFLLAQVLRVDAIGPQELLVGHTESLTDGLSDQLGLVGTVDRMLVTLLHSVFKI